MSFSFNLIIKEDNNSVNDKKSNVNKSDDEIIKKLINI